MLNFNVYTKKILISYLFVIFCILCVVYYCAFVFDGLHTHEPIMGLFFPANIIDHSIYYENYIRLQSGSFEVSGINNVGIAFIYFIYLGLLDSVGLKIDVSTASLALNLFVFFLCFLSFKKIIKGLGLNSSALLLFFFNSSFIYFAQLINKDVFTIFIFYKLIEYSLYGQKKHLFFLFVFSFFIRVQLSLVIAVYIFLIYSRPLFNRLVLCYVILSLFNGYISRYQTLFIDETTLSDGLSSLVHRINVEYGVGSLLLNPLRIVQSIYSVISSFYFIHLDGLDVSKLKNIPQVLVFLLFLPYVFFCFFYYEKYIKTKLKYVICIIPSFFIVWLLNPTINSRYVMLILPFFIFLGYCYQKYRCAKY